MTYSKRHYSLISNGGPDSAESIRERQLAREASCLAVADREAKYPTLTVANAGEALRFQAERIRAHYAELMQHPPTTRGEDAS